MANTTFPYGLPPSEVEEFRELFDLIATDENGVVGETIHVSAIPKLMELLGVGMAQAEVLQAKFAEIDYDQSGDIDFADEFLRVMSRKPSSKYTPGQAEWAFRTLMAGSGQSQAAAQGHVISRAELRQGLLRYLDPPLSELRIDDLLDHAASSLEDAPSGADGEHLPRSGHPASDAIDFMAIINVMNSGAAAE